MSLSRRERRALMEIEFELSQDPNLCEMFAAHRLHHSGRRERARVDPEIRCSSPPFCWRAWWTSIAMQCAVGGLCSEGSHTGRAWLIAMGMTAYPFTLIPLIKGSERMNLQNPSAGGIA